MLIGGTARGPVYTFMVQPAELPRRGGEGGGGEGGANPEDDGAECVEIADVAEMPEGRGC